MEGNSDANYKTFQRFIDKSDPKEVLQRFYHEEISILEQELKATVKETVEGTIEETIEEKVQKALRKRWK